MGRSLRPIDVLVLVVAVGALAFGMGLDAASRSHVVSPPELTVSDALSFFSDDALVVRGYLSREPGGLRLCEARMCAAGPSLTIRGSVEEPQMRAAVLVLGTVRNGRIVLLPGPPSRTARL